MTESNYKRTFIEQCDYNTLVKNLELFIQIEVDEDIQVSNINISKLLDKNIFVYNIYTNNEKVFVMSSTSKFMYYRFDNKRKKYISISKSKWKDLWDILDYTNELLINL